MSITINFTVSDPDVVSAKLYESDGSSGPFSHVYTEAITPSSTSITYSSGSDTKWYYVTFVDSVGGESAPSTIVYGGGESWEDVMISLFRTATNDWSAPQRNDDLTIKRQLVLSASEVYTMAKAVMPFSCEYTFNVDAGSGNNWDIVPDPIYGCKDPNFVNLWLLKAQCDNSRSSFSSVAANAIKIKDGDSSIDTSAGINGYKALLEADGGPCDQFSKAWKTYLYSDPNGANTYMKTTFSNLGSDYIPNYIHIERS